MSDISPTRAPLLILPNNELPRLRSRDHKGRGLLRSVDPLSSGAWYKLAMHHADLVRDVMLHPRSRHTLTTLRRTGQRILRKRDGASHESAQRDALAIALNPVTNHLEIVPNPARNGRTAVDKLVSRFGERVIDGARVLFIPGTTLPRAPQLVALSTARENGSLFTDFWMPAADQWEPRGSAIALHKKGGVRERLSVADFMRAILDKTTIALQNGKTPAQVIDLDGTTYHARLHAWNIFTSWLSTVTGRDAGERKEIKRLRGTVADLEKPLLGYDIIDTLTQLHVTNQSLLASAALCYRARYATPERNYDVPPIPGMVNIVKFLQRVGLQTIFITNRPVQYDILPDGSSATNAALERDGILPPGVEPIMGNGEELPKNERLNAYLARHPDYQVVLAAENDLNYAKGYHEQHGDKAVIAFVEGDRPPGTEKAMLPSGIFSITNAGDLEHHFAEWSAKQVFKPIPRTGVAVAPPPLVPTLTAVAPLVMSLWNCIVP